MKQELYSDSAIEASDVSADMTEPDQSLTRSLRPRTSLPKADPLVTRKSTRTRTQRVVTITKPVKSKAATTTKQKAAPKIETVRQRVRNEIASTTKPKRDAFLYHHRKLFEPLLPASSYISKLNPAHMQGLQPHILIENQPANINANLKPHQLVGLQFLVNMYMNGVSAVLGDEMGLGKTLQTLSLFQYLEDNYPTSAALSRPYLVVCPLSVLETWCEEAQKWTPKLKVLRFHGAAAERANIKASATGLGAKSKFDVMVTTYETFQAEQSWFKSSNIWRIVCLDEAQRIKNDETVQSTALHGVDSEHRLLLTGTPLQNNLRELWALLHWLFPLVFTKLTSRLFEDAFDLSRGHVDTKFMDHARSILELIMLRRMKSDPGVDLSLPPKTEVLLYLPLAPLQQFWYKRLLTRLPNPVLNDLFGNSKRREIQDAKIANEEARSLSHDASVTLENGNDFTTQSRIMIQQAIVAGDTADKETNAYKKLLNLVMQLRKTCTHPYQIKGATPEPYYLGDHIMHASSKFIVLNKLVDELVMQQRKKIIIFSGFTRALDLCEDLLLNKGANQYTAPFHYVRFDGSTARARRNLQVRLFNDPASDYRVMLISTRAGGLGLNLASACSDVVFLDEDWNPQVTLQAESRAHRIGQTKPVTIWKLLCQGTVEEQMMGRIRKKLYLSTKITDQMQDRHTNLKRKRVSDVEDTVEDDTPQLGATQLKSLIRRGAATLIHPEIDVQDMLNWDLDTIVEKCKDKTIDPEANDPSVPNGSEEEIKEEEWLAQMERVETSVFDGARYQREKEKADALPEIVSRADRRIGKNTTVMVNGYAITKESMNCGAWEAVPTLAGKDPRLAEPKREAKASIVHQEHCQVCFDGGEIFLCGLCPRSYHKVCLPKEYQGKSKSIANALFCPQHYCIECGQNTSNVGGLMYRCRWCHRGSCEDCTDWTRTKLLGETLPEYEVAGFHAQKQAWYIECASCIEEMAINAPWAQFVQDIKEEYEEKYDKYMKSFDIPSDMSLTAPAHIDESDQDLAKETSKETVENKVVMVDGETVRSMQDTELAVDQEKAVTTQPAQYGEPIRGSHSQAGPLPKKQKIDVVDLSSD